MSDATRSEEPHDRLTRICAAITKTIDRHPEHLEGDKGILFLDNDDEGKGGMVLFGYDDDRDAIADVFSHLGALFEANGMTLQLMPVGEQNAGMQ